MPGSSRQHVSQLRRSHPVENERVRFILGLDGQTTAAFREILEFVALAEPFDVQITILTPFPGTPLYERLLREGRILEPGAWQLCTLFDVNYQPTGMTPQELREGIYELGAQLYSDEATRRRRKGFFSQFNLNPKAPSTRQDADAEPAMSPTGLR